MQRMCEFFQRFKQVFDRASFYFGKNASAVHAGITEDIFTGCIFNLLTQKAYLALCLLPNFYIQISYT